MVSTFKDGRLDEEYTKHVLTKAFTNELVESGIIAEEAEVRQKVVSIQNETVMPV